MAEDTRSITITFPRQLLEELDAVVPTGKRSEVIVEATAAYLRRIKVLAALRETQGAWRDEDHPELVTLATAMAHDLILLTYNPRCFPMQDLKRYEDMPALS